jgi:hypothetical protein
MSKRVATNLQQKRNQMIPTSKEIRASLLAVFKNHDAVSEAPYDTTVPLPLLVSYVRERMNISPAEFAKATDKIKAHIQLSSSEAGDGAFVIKKGPGGGVSLTKGTKL